MRQSAHVPSFRGPSRTVHAWLRMAEMTHVLANPSALLTVQWLGIARRIRWRDGFEVRCDRHNLATVRHLVGLSSHGARLSSDGRADPATWMVQLTENRIVSPEGIVFALDTIDPLILAETFLHDVHFSGFDLRGQVVVDVGSNLGDTPLYYASKGATVYAFEPDPENFAKLLRNVELNPTLASRIHPFNYAVGPTGVVRFHSGLGGGSGLYESAGKEIELRSVSLSEILERNQLDRPLLLKADCKGCEYDLILDPALPRFQSVMFEYGSHRPPHDLAEILQTLRGLGFAQFRVYKQNWGMYRLSEHGVVHAKR